MFENYNVLQVEIKEGLVQDINGLPISLWVGGKMKKLIALVYCRPFNNKSNLT